ncbi:hypothetical protein HY636_06435 [Candidatus Woesearchaeota archaeon]|nr:hypothetical protein [Candidatus Woesearchaeota archaeon]
MTIETITGDLPTVAQMEPLKVASSREYTYLYVQASVRGEEKDKIFYLFPNLEEMLQGKDVLEIGCAGGSLVREFQARGIKAEGIDMYHTPANAGVSKGDFMDLPHDKKYSAIIALGVFEEEAIYADVALNRSSEAIERLHQNGGKEMLQKLGVLLTDDGFCILKTYMYPLIFTPQMAKIEGFSLRKYKRQLNTTRYPVGRISDMNVHFSPENWYLLSKRRAKHRTFRSLMNFLHEKMRM